MSAGYVFIHGLGPAMQALHDMVREIAQTDIPVLITGECGVGKDAVARLIHRLSPRKEDPFHKLNCASLEVELLPRQTRNTSGNPSSAALHGTVYLDNIQELDAVAQRAVLSYLCEAEDNDLGLAQEVRVISSASSNLELEIELSRFRRELYLRLNGTCLRIPPLRERMEDIPILAEHFLGKHSAALKKSAPAWTESARTTLREYHWPGNLRELENFTRRAVLFGDFQIALNELRPPGNGPIPAQPSPSSSLKTAARAASKKAERELILQALERTHWNRKRAARDLQISYKSLLYKIKQIGVSERKPEG
jgi:DNA-binding NtrC family response regulator